VVRKDYDHDFANSPDSAIALAGTCWRIPCPPSLRSIRRTSHKMRFPRLCSAFLFGSLSLLHAAPKDDLVLQWNSAALQAAHDSHLAAPMIARALAVVHTCIYDAWVGYDDHAIGTQLLGGLRRPASERTVANKEKAVSYAAYRALVDLLPADTESVYKPLMKELGYNSNDNSTDIETPEGIGNVACGAVLEFRHHDKSNQLGDLEQGPYSDWTHFRPVNMPSLVPIHFPSIHPIDPSRWQPLIYIDSTGAFGTQMFTTAHWCYITPFALESGDEFRTTAKDVPPAKYGDPQYTAQAKELIELSANLSDREMMLAEYWTDNPDSDQAPIRWNRFAEWISAQDHYSLDDDVKMFFVLDNALLDSSIAAWDMKRTFDSVRPLTAIALLSNGQKIKAWGGPGKGTVEMDGSQWKPYELATSPTPSSPEYVSAVSTYSAAAASVLARWTGNDRFGYSVTFSKGSSRIEPGITPHQVLTLKWATFEDAVNDAGQAQLYGGTHFRNGDLAGRKLGRLVAAKAWRRAQSYFDGSAKPLLRTNQNSSMAADQGR